MRECHNCGAKRRSGNSCRRCGHLDREVIESIQMSPAATPSRRNHIPPRTPNNSFEKGIRKDERGVPYLDKEGSPLHFKETFKAKDYERSVGTTSNGDN